MGQKINPNSDRDYINNANVNDEKKYPLFFHKIKFEKFRHIENLTINFNNPITVISGTNKSGKTTVLLSIACSHYNFKRRNVSNGNLERYRWGDIMRFTKFDKQNEDWTYYVDYREGTKKISEKRGQRKFLTNKWNGVAKKESQIGTPTQTKINGGRSVIFVDLDRIFPGRGLPNSLFNKLRKTTNSTDLSNVKKDYLSHILEVNYEIGSILKSADKEVFKFVSNNSSYSSFNTASGEDVLSRIVSDIVDAEKNSLILIEEIEIGLHPKIQRRLLDVIYHESRENNKQFIITSHSQTILSAVDKSSRIFIEKTKTGYKSIENISVNAALSKMDSLGYPLVNLFIEDELAEKIVKKAIIQITENKGVIGFNDLLNIIISGSAKDTYDNFLIHKRTNNLKRIDCGFACILDGDMKDSKTKSLDSYPSQEGLFFLFSNKAPEFFLVQHYLKTSPNPNISYHLNSNPHCLFDKMVEFGEAIDRDNAFEKCWNSFSNSPEGTQFLEELCNFLIDCCIRFSPDL